MIRIVLKESVLIIVNQLILWATCVVNCLQRILWLPTMFLKMYSWNISTNTEKKWSIKEMPRIGKREPLLDCISKLQELTVPYLLHQFSVCCDTVYWKEFLFQTYHYVLWLDYSQNLALKGKGQVQSAHILVNNKPYTPSFSTSQITKVTSSFTTFQMTPRTLESLAKFNI